MGEARGLDHAEWLGVLLDCELTLRRQKQFESRARVAKLRHSASIEDVNYQTPRGLDRALFPNLSACDWIAVALRQSVGRAMLVGAMANVTVAPPWDQLMRPTRSPMT